MTQYKKFIYQFVSISLLLNIAQESQAQIGASIGLNNVAVSVDLLGPLFGRIFLGVGSFISPWLQIGVSGGYYFYSSFNTTKLKGWSAQLDTTGFLTPETNSFFLGTSVGYEHVKVRKNLENETKTHNDMIWNIKPGYSWRTNARSRILAGAQMGYGFGSNYIAPFVGAIIIL